MILLANWDSEIPGQMQLGTGGSAGFDLCTVDTHTFSFQGMPVILDTGVSVEIPIGHVGLVFARSSLFLNGFSLANGVGVIDADYRGTIKLAMVSRHRGAIIPAGSRVAQLLVLALPRVALILTKTLSSTERGSGGFGSTGPVTSDRG